MQQSFDSIGNRLDFAKLAIGSKNLDTFKLPFIIFLFITTFRLPPSAFRLRPFWFTKTLMLQLPKRAIARLLFCLKLDLKLRKGLSQASKCTIRLDEQQRVSHFACGFAGRRVNRQRDDQLPRTLAEQSQNVVLRGRKIIKSIHNDQIELQRSLRKDFTRRPKAPFGIVKLTLMQLLLVSGVDVREFPISSIATRALLTPPLKILGPRIVPF